MVSVTSKLRLLKTVSNYFFAFKHYILELIIKHHKNIGQVQGHIQLWFDFKTLLLLPHLHCPSIYIDDRFRYSKAGVFFCKLHVFNCWHLLIFLLTSVLATQVVFLHKQLWQPAGWLAGRPGGGSSDKQAVWPGDRLSWQHGWLVHCFALLGHTPEWQSKQNSWNVETEQAEFALALHHDSSFPGWINFHFFINGEQSKNRENPPLD